MATWDIRSKKDRFDLPDRSFLLARNSLEGPGEPDHHAVWERKTPSGCETKYQHHLNNHTRLGRFLRSLGEKTAADWWEALDLTRQAGWYGGEPDPADAHKALSLLEQIRLWATQ